MNFLGRYVKQRREALKARYRGFSGRAVAKRMGIHYSYLSKLERGEYAPLSEERIRALARELDDNPELLLALGGKLSSRSAELISGNPRGFIQFLQDLEREQEREADEDSYINALQRRKSELEELSRRLREEVEKRCTLEQSIRQEFTRYYTLFHLLPDAAVLAELETGTILDVNAAALQLWRKSREELVGSHQSTLHPSHGNAERSQKFGKHGTEQLSLPVKAVIQRRDGEIVPVLVSAARVEFEARVQVLGVFRDISALVKTELALEESERRWKFALEGAQLGVWDMDFTSGKVFYSKRWKEVLGYGEHELSDGVEEWERRIHPADLKDVFTAVEQHLNGQTPFYEFEHRLRHKDGSYRWILDRGLVVERAPDGMPLRAIGTHDDVTKRHAAEERLQLNEAFFRTLLDSIQDGICVLNSDLTIRYANPAIQRQFAAQETLEGRLCHHVFHQRPISCELCPVKRCLVSGHTESSAIHNGSRWLEFTAYPIRDAATQTITGAVEFVRDVTDRMQAETACEASELRYRTLFEQNPTVQLLIDPQTGAVAQANQAARAFYGYSADEFARMSIVELSAQPRPINPAIMEQVRQGLGDIFTFQHQLKSGEQREVEIRSSAVEVEGQALLHSIIVDVSERNQALRSLQEQNERLLAAELRLRMLFENAPLGICSVTREGRYLGVNAAHALMYGYSCPEEMLALSPDSHAAYVDPRQREVLFSLLERLHVVKDFESQMRRKDGSPFWTARTVRALLDAAGEVEGYEAFVQDISQRVTAEFESERARRQLLAVLEQLNAGVYVLRASDMRIAYANAYLRNALGSDLEGRPGKEALLAEASSCPFLPGLDGFASAGDAVTRELLFTNGRWYLCTARIAAWEDEPLSILVVAQDITESKQAEELRADIDRMLRHDLKSPLNGIIGLPEIMLASGNWEADDALMLRAIQDSGKKMLRLIDRSLTLYKLETGRYELLRQPVQLQSQLGTLFLEQKELCQAKEVSFQLLLDGNPLPETLRLELLVDATLFPFLLSNLLKNAVEAAPRGSTVTVDIHDQEPFRLGIHNQGAVPLEVRERFFEKYSTFGKRSGTGLGTYSARLIAQAHGGEIILETSEQHGTTLTIIMPRTQAGVM